MMSKRVMLDIRIQSFRSLHLRIVTSQCGESSGDSPETLPPHVRHRLSTTCLIHCPEQKRRPSSVGHAAELLRSRIWAEALQNAIQHPTQGILCASRHFCMYCTMAMSLHEVASAFAHDSRQWHALIVVEEAHTNAAHRGSDPEHQHVEEDRVVQALQVVEHEDEGAQRQQHGACGEKYLDTGAGRIDPSAPTMHICWYKADRDEQDSRGLATWVETGKRGRTSQWAAVLNDDDAVSSKGKARSRAMSGKLSSPVLPRLCNRGVALRLGHAVELSPTISVWLRTLEFLVPT